LVLGGVLTSYAEEVQRTALLPVRNLLVLGQLRNRPVTNIGVTAYPDGAGVNPVHVAQLVRPLALRVLDGDDIDPDSAALIVSVAEFLQGGLVRDNYDSNTFAVFPYTFPYDVYSLEPPWASGMAQGHIIEVLLAAFEVDGDSIYLVTDREAANALSVPTTAGGTGVHLPSGLWFEEYASKSAEPSFALNGHVFALEALYRLARADSSYLSVFRDGVGATRSMLPQFDVGWWSLYDLHGRPANRKYQAIHARQMATLHQWTGHAEFARYAREFRNDLLQPAS